MTPSTVQAEIRRLESYRQQAFWWRTGAFVVLVAVVGGSLLSLNASVRALTERGPGQEEFVQTFSEGFRRDVMPNVQTLASQTLSEIEPQIQREFTALNARVPELTQATMKEFETLQRTLPKSSEKTLDDSFRSLLTSCEAKIREMYPDVTEAQVTTFMTNLRTTGETEIRAANDELFSPHQAKLASILEHMEAIRASEAANVGGADPNWEMGLAILDVVRDDLRTMKAPTSGSADANRSATNEAGASSASATKNASNGGEVKR